MLYFISDVHSDITSPHAVTTTLATILDGQHVYDAGDLVEHGTGPIIPGFPTTEEQEYDQYVSLFPNSTPVPGNHDTYDGLLSWRWPQVKFTSFSQGVRVVGAHSGQLLEDREWIDSQLSLPGFNIFMMHHPLYSDNLRVGSVAQSMREQIGDVAAKAKLVITGHGHAYEHHKVGDTHYLVIGGGGAPLDQVGTSESLIKAESSHHYVRVQALTDGVIVEVLRFDETFIERFSVKGPVIPYVKYNYKTSS